MKIDTPATPKTDEELAAIFNDIREALRRFPANANRNDRARLCIGICIANGIDTMRPIIGMLMKLGFGNRHAGAILMGSTGTDPVLHFWTRDEQGRYSNLDKPSSLPQMP